MTPKRPHPPFEIEVYRRATRRSWRRLWPLAVVVLVGVLAWSVWPWMQPSPTPPLEPLPSAANEPPSGPPWFYGRPDARVTVIEYADLECPYCRMYFPLLKAWIDAHPDARWQWQHFPLAAHEPAATTGARLVECAGEAGGHAAFWQAVEWVYAHTRGDGQGLPEGLHYPGLTPAVQQCLGSTRPDAVVRAQSSDAAQYGVQATPTLRLQDRESGKALLLHGPVEGDALLSAIDLLTAGTTAEATAKEMPAAPVGDMSR